MYSITIDRLGFPMASHRDLDFDIQLTPVMKVQFEMFLAEENGFDDAWYNEIIALNPRPDSNKPRINSQYITGIRPNEASVFANWLGSEYEIPSASTWLAAHAKLMQCHQKPSKKDVACVSSMPFGRDHAPPTNISFMCPEHFMEWVRDRGRWKLIGNSTQLYSHRLPVVPIDVEKRDGINGFRLMRRRSGRGQRTPNSTTRFTFSARS